MTTLRRGLLAMLGGALLATAAEGAPEGADPLVERLQARLESLRTLRGRFTQQLDAPGLGRSRTERGSFFFRKPAMMRWEYEEPERKLAVTDGRTGWLYLPAERQAHRGRLADLGEGGAAALLLSGKVRLAREFRARRLSIEEAGPQGFAGADVLEMVPLKRTEAFARLVIAVDPARQLVRRLTAVGVEGDRMAFDFYDLVEDVPLSEDLFRFEAPEGVEVVDVR